MKIKQTWRVLFDNRSHSHVYYSMYVYYSMHGEIKSGVKVCSCIYKSKTENHLISGWVALTIARLFGVSKIKHKS